LKALPVNFNLSLLVYNTALFDAAGLAYPNADWTKDEFLTAAKALTLKSGDRITQWGVDAEPWWWGTWLPFIRQAGGDWMDPKTGEVTLDSPEAVAGIEYLASLLLPGPDQVSSLETKDPTLAAQVGFLSGTVGMSYGSHTFWWELLREAKIPFDVEVLPKGLKRQRGGEQTLTAYSIHQDTKSPAAAWEVLKYMSGFDAQSQYINAPGPTPRRDVAAHFEQRPMASRPVPHNLEAVFTGFDEGIGMPLPHNLGFFDANDNIIQPIMNKILAGELPVAEGLKQATQDAQKYIDATYPNGGMY
jgi:multiple sugar transport system substrate-binding protein